MTFAVLTLTSENGSKSVQTNRPVTGGTLVWGTNNPPTIINPVLTSHSVSSALMDLIFDSLLRVSPNGKMVPGLAYRWESSPDEKVYTFYLHKKVYFHDGYELTADDVKFTYDSIHDPVNQSQWRASTLYIKEWRVVDRYTIQMVLANPVNNPLDALTREILPRHLFDSTIQSNRNFNYQPIGSGPFRFSSWDEKTHQIILEANKAYFEGRPYLDKIIVKTYSDNNALWSALMRGEVDFIKFLNREDYEVIENDPRFKTYEINGGVNYSIVYNMNDPILADRKVRQALNYAVDRTAMMRICKFNGVESNGPFAPNTPGYNPDVEKPSYNPERAQELLASSGWKMNPTEGVLYKSGKPFVLTMLVDKNQGYFYQIALVLRQQLSQLGIVLKVVFYDRQEELTSEFLENNKPQMWLRFFLNQETDDAAKSSRSWYSISSEHGRLWPYENKIIDELFEQGLKARDVNERIRVYKKIHALIYEDQPVCFLFFSMSYGAVASTIENTDSFFTPYMPDYYIKKWYIIQKGGGQNGNYSNWDQ